MNIKEKLRILIIMSFLSIFVLMGISIYNEVKNRIKISTVDSFLEFTKQSSTLLHELQKERSISIIYLSSDGKILGDIISKQIKNTDEKISIYKKFVNSNSSTFISYDNNYEIILKDIAKMVPEIKKIREKIINKETDEDGAYKYYGDLNFNLLSIVSLNGKYAPISKVSNDHISYGFLLKAKEIASLKRAIISSSFIKKEFTNDEIRKIVSLIAEENTYKAIFTNSIDKNMLDFYNKNMITSNMEEAKTIIYNALKSATDGSLEVDMEKWFNIVAKNIEAYKNIDEFSINEIRNSNITPFLNMNVYSIIIGVVFSILIYILVLFLSKDITKRIHSHDWIID